MPDGGVRTRLPTGMIMPGLPEPELFTDDSAKRPGAVTRPTAHRAPLRPGCRSRRLLRRGIYGSDGLRLAESR